MKKRYLVAATSALIGGSLFLEMQVGSTGLPSIDLPVPNSAGAGGGGGGASGGGGSAVAESLVVSAVGGAAKAPRVRPAVDDLPPAATDGFSADAELGLTGSAGREPMPVAFDGVLLTSPGFDGAMARLPGGLGTDGFDAVAGVGGYSGVNSFSSRGLTPTALPQAVSAVPEPATWISFIVGLGLVGFNLRRRLGMRSVAS